MWVISEKAADVVALVILWALGWSAVHLGGHVGWVFAAVLVAAMLGWALRLGSGRATPWASLAGWSLGLWALHLLQIDLFLKAAGVSVPWYEVLARVPGAIFAGLLPISLWGLGTRDVALVYLFADVAAPSTMAVVGLLTALRYVVPGAAGIPLLVSVWSGRSAETAELL